MDLDSVEMLNNGKKAIKSFILDVDKTAMKMDLIIERLAELQKCGLTLSEYKAQISSELVEKTNSKGIKKILKHTLSGNKGELVEIRDHSIRGKIYIIKLSDGREYFAPAYEFRVVNK